MTEPSADASAEASAGFDRRLLAPMVLGSILNPVNSSMIAVSLVPIGLAFGATPAQTAWLVSGLYLATAIGQPVVGRLVDTYGPRRVYLVGTALTGVAGLLGALAPSLGVLVGARVLLGIGTCAGYPASMYLIRSEAERTGRDSPAGVLTVLAVANQTVAVVGPSLGGLLVGLGGWQTIFAVNVPLSLACGVLGRLRLPRRTPIEGAGRDESASQALDVPGMLLFAAMLISLLLYLMQLDVVHLWLLAVSAAAAAGLTRRELGTPQPFLDLRVLAGNLPLLATYGRTLCAMIVSYAFLYGFTPWLEGGRGLTPSQAGLVLLPLFGTAIVVSTLTGRHPRIRGKLVVGGVLQAVVCVLMLTVTDVSPVWLLLAVVAVMGLPQGLLSLANQNAVYHQADPERMGSSAGLLRTFGYLGAIGASAASGAFFGSGHSSAGLHGLTWFLLGVSLVGLALTLVDRSLAAVGRPDASPAGSGAAASAPRRAGP